MPKDTPLYHNTYTYLGGADTVQEPAAAYGLKSRIGLIRRGLPAQSLEHFLSSSCLNRQQLGRVLQVSPRTMQRYPKDKTLPPFVSEKLLQLNDLYEQAADILGGGSSNISNWLQNSNQALGGERPLDLLDTYEGLRQVQNVLGRIAHGVYS